MQDQEGVAIATPAPESVSSEVDIDSYRAQREGKTPPPQPEAKPAEPQAAPPAEAPATEQEAKTEPESATGEEEQQQDPQTPKEKGKGGFQRRIDKLTEERYRLEGEVRALREQLAGKPAGAEAQPKEDKPPAETDFDNWNDYLRASVQYEAKQLLRAEKEAEAKRQAEEAQRSRMDAFQQRAERARESFEDFDEVIGNPNLPVTEAMNEAILESEHGPQLAYWLGKNPARCIEIARMSPLAATREMLKIESQFSTRKSALPTAAPQPKPAAISTAPPPISPVSVNAVPQSSVPPGKMDHDEYRRWRESGGGR